MRVAATAVLAGLLAGCGGFSFTDSNIDYKSATKLPPLEVPPDLTRPGRDDRYAVPDTAGKGSATLSGYNAERAGQPRTGTTDVLPNIQKVSMQRAGSERWLVVSEAPEKVWPIVRDFWQENGFVIIFDSPETGVMETDWAENRAKLPQDVIRNTLGKLLDSVYSTGERDKFRTRLERGSDQNVTEIYITHRGMIEVYTAPSQQDVDTRWQPRDPDPQLEAEFLRRLMVRLGVEEERSKAMVAQATGTQRAKLVKAGDGAGTLEVLEPFDRAWRRVGVALDRVGFTVEDRDREKGLYFVRYADPDVGAGTQQKGFLSRLAFWRSDSKAKAAEQYRVVVADRKETSEVRVLNKDGVPERSETSQRILSLLYDQLR